MLFFSPTGSVMSLMAGLVFGGLSAYGAYNVSNDPKDIQVSLRKYDETHCDIFCLWARKMYLSRCCGVVFISVSAGVLSVIMGMRYKKSGKLLPAGIMAGLRSVKVAQHTWKMAKEIRNYCETEIVDLMIDIFFICVFFFNSLLMVFRLLLLTMMWPGKWTKETLSPNL